MKPLDTCPNGHRYEEGSYTRRPYLNTKICSICRKQRDERRRQRKKEQRALLKQQQAIQPEPVCCSESD